MAAQDEVFKAMADPHRRQILGELCRRSREAGELARMVGLAPNAVSFHLRALKAADLVSVRREGRFLRYSLEPHNVLSWRRQVDQLFPADLLGPEAEPQGAEQGDFRAQVQDASAFSDRMGGGDALPTELL